MTSKRIYLSYVEARDFVRSLGLKGAKEWREYCKTKGLPCNITTRPWIIYKDCGWESWVDWLGTNNRRQKERKYKVNDNYFKTWSSNMAYILGFWFADGNISKNESFIFNISQHKKDKYLLEAILKEMGSNYPLHKNGNNYYFNICSKTIYKDIIRLGGKERKSMDVKFPNIPKKYMPDFIRGLWDGDGCIFYDKWSRRYGSNYVSGSNDLIGGLYCALKKDIPNLNGALYHESNNKIYLRFSKNDTIRLKNFLYQEPLKNKFMLKRKYDLFQKTDDFFTYEFLNYNDAQKIVKSFGIKSIVEWRMCCKSGTIPHNIPICPEGVYENSGWVDWYVWLGKSRNKIVSSE